MPAAPSHIIRWVALYVVPQEQHIRAALRRAGVCDADADDLVQDAYCRLATLRSIDHIDRPGAYFMQIVKNLRRDRLRRERIIRFEDVTENANLFVEHEAVGVEATVAAREQLRLVGRLLADLPDRCRTIFTLKRMEGLSQREIAKRLGVSESVVENDVQKALRTIQRALRTDPGCGPGDSPPEKDFTDVDERRKFEVYG
ncbi:RNA polymerase sigma factor [Novosphingobium sp. UBA1939]|uniref:RNA polymerase sigma factor n=1 Tax=Novosphingobium sp. UBA1939 TaxID=1946982 RepID=UPI0025D0C31A|nr:sigma-70 family RNA polymerase sigma factor [Novosphingobium sp. UBA1939]